VSRECIIEFMHKDVRLEKFKSLLRNSLNILEIDLDKSVKKVL